MIGTCEMCGKETSLVKVQIEGSILLTCLSCAKHGLILEEFAQTTNTPKKYSKQNNLIEKEETIEVIVQDFPQRIKQAREKKNLQQNEVARQLAIKESIIHKLESGKLEPSLDIARKLERFFNIKLVQQYVNDYKHQKQNTLSFTIGDLLTKNEK